MKNYRVKSIENNIFIVQKRVWIFFWFTYGEKDGFILVDKKFNNKNDALLYAKEKKEEDLKFKKEKIIEYI